MGWKIRKDDIDILWEAMKRMFERKESFGMSKRDPDDWEWPYDFTFMPIEENKIQVVESKHNKVLWEKTMTLQEFKKWIYHFPWSKEGRKWKRELRKTWRGKRW